MVAPAVIVIFLFVLGSAIGSFLNVLVYRLPAGQSIIKPGSHCPACKTPIAWYDNIPIVSWLLLRGRCRHCGRRISLRYPLIELTCASAFALLYTAYFIWDVRKLGLRPEDLTANIPMLLAHLVLLAALLAVSVIDWQTYEIPLIVPWAVTAVGLAAATTGALIAPDKAVMLPAAGNVSGAFAVGAAVGLVVMIVLLHGGVLPRSFEKLRQPPSLGNDETTTKGRSAKNKRRIKQQYRRQLRSYKRWVRTEIGKELLAVAVIAAFAVAATVATARIAPLQKLWSSWLGARWFSALAGSLFGTFAGAGVVWLTRIFGTLAFGREAMGMGDVHLMAGVGAVLGWQIPVIAFVLAAFYGLGWSAVSLLGRKYRRDVPYGPWLSLATVTVMIAYEPIVEYLRPGLSGLKLLLKN